MVALEDSILSSMRIYLVISSQDSKMETWILEAVLILQEALEVKEYSDKPGHNHEVTETFK